jgi:NET1-associated nuclear protein 1 (U3 small nucleolar RNA-associated protein 17)
VSITGYALSATHPEWIYVSTSSGDIHRWDWTVGEKLGRWRLADPICQIAVGLQQVADGPVDIIYTRELKANGSTRISAHKLMFGEDAAKSETKTILQYQNPDSISNFQLVLGGKVIVASVGSKLVVGYTSEGPADSPRNSQHVWYEFTSPDNIRCMDVQAVGDSTKTESSDLTPQSSTINVVVGDEGGAVFTHHDLLNKLIRAEQRGGHAVNDSIVPRKLHWHRDSVRSVRFSQDGGSSNTSCPVPGSH